MFFWNLKKRKIRSNTAPVDSLIGDAVLAFEQLRNTMPDLIMPQARM